MKDLFTALKESYETSTKNYNRFAELVYTTNWDSMIIDEDQSMMLVKGKMNFMVASLNPFVGAKPYMMHADGSIVSF